MSTWTHVQCERCWIAAEAFLDADGEIAIRRPTRLTDDLARTCCFCGGLTISGIYRRADPESLPLCIGHCEDGSGVKVPDVGGLSVGLDRGAPVDK